MRGPRRRLALRLDSIGRRRAPSRARTVTQRARTAQIARPARLPCALSSGGGLFRAPPGRYHRAMDAPSAAWVIRRPAPALAHVVERYIGYRAVGFAPGVHRGLPSRHQTFIVGIGPAIDVVA